jgi:hypothetical protein
MEKFFDWYKTWPDWLRKGVTDFVENGIAAIIFLEFVIPSDVDGMVKLAGAAGLAVVGAFVSAVRRRFPEFIQWWREKTNTPEDD